MPIFIEVSLLKWTEVLTEVESYMANMTKITYKPAETFYLRLPDILLKLEAVYQDSLYCLFFNTVRLLVNA